MTNSAKLRFANALLMAPMLYFAQAAWAQEAPDPNNAGARLAGEATLGVRAYSNRPGPTERAKFEQYGELPPGAFLDELHLFTEADSGPLMEAWASNVGLNNQRYQMRFYDPGDYYFTVEYSQLPHLYSTQALTLYENASPAELRIPDAVQSALETAPNDAARAVIINANVHMRDINVTRETGRIGFRWTPSDAWDIRLDYSNEDRRGAMPFGTAINGFNTLELPAPVSYSTQNFSASAQYVGRLTPERRWR